MSLPALLVGISFAPPRPVSFAQSFRLFPRFWPHQRGEVFVNGLLVYLSPLLATPLPSGLYLKLCFALQLRIFNELSSTAYFLYPLFSQ